jgi:hypothetical protein
VLNLPPSAFPASLRALLVQPSSDERHGHRVSAVPRRRRFRLRLPLLETRGGVSAGREPARPREGHRAAEAPD